MTLLLVSFGLLALVLAATLGTVLREKRALGRLVESAVDVEAVQDAITRLPAPHQEIAAQMVEAITVRSTLDEALTKAVVRATNETFEPPLVRRLVTNVVLAIALFAPVSLALLQAADRIVRTFNDAKSHPAAQVYLEGQTQLEGPFATLHAVFFGAAWLVAGLAAWWALRWWLLRPEIREARFIRALLECASRLRPGVAAPVSARLCELVAPDRGLQRPIVATALWFVAVTAGWGILYGTATVRAANNSATVFDVWPKTNAIGTTEALVLPRHRAGRPLPTRPQPSLFVESRQVRFGQQTIAELSEGALPSTWAAEAPNLQPTVRSYDPLEPLVLAHRATVMRTLLDVLREIARRHAVKRYHLIVERTVGLPGVAGGKKIQADIPIALGEAEVGPALTIKIEDTGVKIAEEGLELPFSEPDWANRLRDFVRLRPDLYGGDARAPLLVRTSDRISYERFIEVIGAADTACMKATDCGLPGLGIAIVVQRLP